MAIGVVGYTLLLAQAAAVLDLARSQSATYNEPGHVAAGLAYWHSGDYAFYSVNPPLSRLVATAPLLLDERLCLDFLDKIDPRHPRRQEIEIGSEFADSNALIFHDLIVRARLAGVLWCFAGGLLVWRWSERLFGEIGGLLSTACWAADPTVAANASQATCDLPAAVCALLAAYAFWRFSNTRNWRDALGVSITLGIGVLTKLTLLMLPILWLGLWAAMGFPAVGGRGERRARVVAPVVILLLLPLVIVAIGYEWQRVGEPIRDLSARSESFQRMQSLAERAGLGWIPVPLPLALVDGVDWQQVDFQGRLESYLHGEWRRVGWPHYYALAYSYKTPLGMILLHGAMVVALATRRVRAPAVLWVTPLAVLILASMKYGYTNHYRYVLAMHPFVCVLVGGLLAAAPSRKALVGCSLCVLLALASVASRHPHLLGYFNEAVGGPQQGWRLLAASNVDWGQDWLRAREWIDAHAGAEDLSIALVGVADPSIYLGRGLRAPRPGRPGLVLVDAQSLTRDHAWLSRHELVARVGASLFVYRID